MCYMAILLFLVLLALQSEQVLPAVRDAMVICYRTVIPSLFPFFVFSGLLLGGGFAEQCARWLSVVMKPLFNVGGAGALSLVIGLISGYPMGAKITAELYKNGDINRTEAERLLPFCNNSGPLFVIGAVGVGMFNSGRTGLFLYAIHGICALLVGVCFRFYGKNTLPQATKHFSKSRVAGKSFATAVAEGVDTVMVVCGYILLFAALETCLFSVLGPILPQGLLIGCKGLAEVTTGCFSAVQSGLSARFAVSLVAGFLGFGGVCVMLQAKGMLQGTDLGFKSYVIGKMLHGVFSALMAFFLYPFVVLESVSTLAEVHQNRVFHFVFNWSTCVGTFFVLFSCLFLCIKFKKTKRG